MYMLKLSLRRKMIPPKHTHERKLRRETVMKRVIAPENMAYMFVPFKRKSARRNACYARKISPIC